MCGGCRAAGRGLPGCAPVSPRGTTAGVHLCEKSSGRFPARSRPGGGADSAALAGARRPPRARSGEGRGRRIPETWRERGGPARGSWRSTEEAREALLAASRPSGSSWRLAALLPPVSCSGSPGDAFPSRQWRPPHLFSFQSGRPGENARAGCHLWTPEPSGRGGEGPGAGTTSAAK